MFVSSCILLRKMWFSSPTGALLPASELADKLSAGADANRAIPSNGRAALHVAAAAGELEAISTLLSARADTLSFDADNRSPLALACLHGKGEAVARLIEATAPKHRAPLLGMADANAWTCLHHAASGGSADAVVALLQAGAKSAAREKAGRTPFHVAAAAGHQLVVEALVDGEGGVASAWLTDSAGRTALMCAAQEGHHEVCSVLLRHTTPSEGGIGSQDKEGLSALAWAAVMGHGEVCQLLLSAGADFSSLGQDELRALEETLEAHEAEQTGTAVAAAAAVAAVVAPETGGGAAVGMPAGTHGGYDTFVAAAVRRTRDTAVGPQVVVVEDEAAEDGEQAEQPAALVLVAKWPGSGSAKTRLARGIAAALAAPGADETDAGTAAAKELASGFARAAVSDLVCNFGAGLRVRPPAALRRVLLYAPPTEDARAGFAALLEAAAQPTEAWTLLPVLGTADARASDLGALLADAASRCQRQLGCGRLVFIGMDTPDLPPSALEAALRRCAAPHAAHLCPASDGGYVLLGAPRSLHARGHAALFEGVEWSCAETCASQQAALDRAGLAVAVGETYSDCDELDDVRALQRRLADPSGAAPHCPHVLAWLRQLDERLAA